MGLHFKELGVEQLQNILLNGQILSNSDIERQGISIQGCQLYYKVFIQFKYQRHNGHNGRDLKCGSVFTYTIALKQFFFK